MSSKSPADRVPGPPLRSTTNSRSGSGNESGRNKKALTTLKIAVLAPMPSASVSTATAVKPGFFSNWRKANLRSFITQGLHWIDFRRLPSWEIAREYCRGNQEPRGNRNGDWVYRWQPVELRGDQTLRGQHCWCSDDQSDNEDEGVLRIFYHADDFSFVLPSCFRSADMKMLSDGGLTRE